MVFDKFALLVSVCLASCVAQEPRDCSDGWIVYRESCYFVGREAKNWDDARNHCGQFSATLLSINSDREFDTIVKPYSTRNRLTWLGLSYSTQAWDEGPMWEGGSQHPISRLPWMNTVDYENGHESGSDCVAFFSSDNPRSNSYVNWYSCNVPYFYICERNSTTHFLRK